MKKITLLALLFAFHLVAAQSTHNFKYRLDYQLEGTDEEETSYFQGKHFVPEKFSEQSKNSLAIFPFFAISAQSEFSFIDGNTIITIQNTDLDNNFEMISTDYYGYDNAVRVMYDNAVLKKTDREQLTILDKKCTQYQLFVTMDGEPETDADLVFCVDETSEIDNLSFLIQQKTNPVKGLILAVSPSNNEKEERIVLKKITPINSTIHFDAKQELAAFKVKKDSLEKIYNSYASDSTAYAVDTAYATEAYDYYSEYVNQPEFCNYTGFYELQFEGENSYSVASSYLSNLCSNTYYLKKGDEEKFKKFALKEIKSIKKNYAKTGLMTKKDANMFYEFLKKDLDKLEKAKPKTAAELAVEAAAEEAAIAAADAAYATVDSAYYADGYNYDVYVSDYETVYKTMKPEDSNFAITSLQADPESPYWKGMPAFCKKFETIVPAFSDEELKKRAKNYAGQMCDMYLGEFEGTSVWYKGTLDAIRSEQLYFNNNRDKFSKKDRELLDEFLNNLD